MNEHLRKMMIDAGYAAPELATRGRKLADIIIADILLMVASAGVAVTREGSEYTAEQIVDELDAMIVERYGVEE